MSKVVPMPGSLGLQALLVLGLSSPFPLEIWDASSSGAGKMISFL